ncbi:ABC transporter ATP-binding protein [Staphylococcus cohnii]|uniref:ABC transporter ATP-binding protein n=1 Tax=Staphylococcus cohnii TaxID=29382 RepID=UPI0007D8EF2E|nr:ABC transporter ATP-binding protein [Staphylococcus cohnii]OAO09818.1 multidrug ABC transporter ATP-binding protein [Staphylococcus cohnii]
MEYLLNVQNLNKTYVDSDFNLNQINLTIEPNTVVGLIGKNGSGKSTLINTLVGNRFADAGDIQFFDTQISRDDYAYKEHLGVVFDDLRLPNKLNAKQISKVFSNIYRTWDEQHFFEMLENFELPKERQIKSFSRGMSMKISISIALSHDSKLLILDEATAGMDVSGREEVLEILEDFVDEGNGILISSHISEDIETLADKLIFMKNGRILLQEHKDTLLNDYGIVSFEEGEFDVNHSNVVAYRLHKGTGKALVNQNKDVELAQPLKNIDDATKILMRGELA